jgi:hypothetical protein
VFSRQISDTTHQLHLKLDQRNPASRIQSETLWEQAIITPSDSQPTTPPTDVIDHPDILPRTTHFLQGASMRLSTSLVDGSDDQHIGNIEKAILSCFCHTTQPTNEPSTSTNGCTVNILALQFHNKLSLTPTTSLHVAPLLSTCATLDFFFNMIIRARNRRHALRRAHRFNLTICPILQTLLCRLPSCTLQLY